MERRVAVQVQYPRVSYVDLFPLDGRRRTHRRLSPIEVDQRVAVVRLFLMHRERRSEGAVVPEEELRTFRVGGLPPGADRAPVLTLDAEYDGGRSLRVSISGPGGISQVADIRVPRPARLRRRRWWWVAAAAILVLLGGGAFLTARLLGTPSGSTMTRPANATSAGADQADTDYSVGTGTGTGTGSETGTEAPSITDTPDTPETEPLQDAAEDETAALSADERSRRAAPDGNDLPEAALPRSESTVYFEPNRTRLTEAARRELNEVASLLREHPEVPVSIVGHTALYGTEEGRMEISQGRAQGVAAYLRSRGWEPRTDPSVEWVGSQNPATRERDQQQQNRRVQITIGEDESPR